MSYTENALVIHRVGGLEVRAVLSEKLQSVIHRVGGLEGQQATHGNAKAVIHRVGGLEVT